MNCRRDEDFHDILHFERSGVDIGRAVGQRATMISRTATALAAMLIATALVAPVPAQDEDVEPEKEFGWFNETEFSLVSTRGNIDTDTLGLKNKLRRITKHARFQLRIEGVRADSGGLRTAVAKDPNNPDPADFDVVESDRVTDVETWLFEGRYDRNFAKRTFWNAGASWDRNLSAGIRARFMVFGTIGHVWWDREELKFNTTYGLSIVDRDEYIEDPTKDNRFTAFRFDWGYRNTLTKNSEYTNDWTINVNLDDLHDWTSNMTNAFTIGISDRLALRVGLQLLYNARPALESLPFCIDVDMSACPGFAVAEKEQLDLIFTTGLVVRL